MALFLLGVSFIINLFYIFITFYIFKNKRKLNFLKSEVDDIETFKDFFNSNRIDF